MNKTYLFGKIGKSIKFNENTWSAIGGDNEAPKLIKAIAELNPNDNFIIIGKNDIQKSKNINLPKNLFDIYEGASKNDKSDNLYIFNKLKDIKIDGCFLISGPCGTTNIPNSLYKRKELKNNEKIFAKSLETFQLYVAPIYQFLNKSMIPWLMIVNDPRYIQQGNDLLNPPKKILSQYDEIIQMKGINNFIEQKHIITKLQISYDEMEKMFLIGSKKPIEYLKTKKFMIILNQGNNGVKSRYPELKKFVLDYIDDVQIFGQWDDEIIKNDKRFKGSKKFIDFQQDLKYIKYTFIIPIKKGWVTSKWVEMISFGIIPFFHPEYDLQKHCNVPEFIRIKNPQELHEKIEFLEKNPQEYTKILNQCLMCIKDSDLDGTNLNNILMKNIPQINKDGKIFKCDKQIISTLEEW
jgi:hypothetical protein